MENEKLKEKVLQKLEKEYDDFIEELKECKPEVIIERAYEKVVKEEMKEGFSYKELSTTELRALLKSDGILNECYDDWINRDGNFDDILFDSVNDTIDIIVEDYKREIKAKSKDGR